MAIILIRVREAANKLELLKLHENITENNVKKGSRLEAFESSLAEVSEYDWRPNLVKNHERREAKYGELFIIS